MSLTPPSSEYQEIWNHTLHWASLQYSNFMDDTILQPLFEKFVAKTFKPLPLPYAIPDIKDLVIRRISPGEVAAVVGLITQDGMHTPANATKILEQFLSDPLVWPLIWEWRGKPIQFEAISLGPDDSSYIGYLVHFKRAHPQWFWGACEAPVRQWLEERGYTTMRSLMRKNRAHRVRRVQKVYNVKQTGELGDFLQLEWALIGDQLPQWPERRTAGAKWFADYKNISFREMAAADLPSVKAEIRRSFAERNLKNGDEAADLLEERWELERAAVLLGYVNEKLVFVRAAREREPGQAAISLLTPVIAGEDARAASYIALEWLKALGYTSAVSFVPAAQYRSSRMKQYMAAVAPYLVETDQFPHFDGLVYEVGISDFDTVLKQSITEYVEAYEAGKK